MKVPNNLAKKFQLTVSEHKYKVALKFCDATVLTFTELDILSNKIANLLLVKKIESGQVIAIQNHKSAFGYACMLACLKIGAIYTNFDDENPKERLIKIFDTAKPVLVISDTKLCNTASEICSEKDIVTFDYSLPSSQELVDNQATVLPSDIIDSVIGEMPAYIMFTSGSTGIPKGVLIKHQSIINFIDWSKDTYSITSNDTLTNVNPIYFDNSVFDFYCSIFNGASLAAIPKDIVAKPKLLLEHIDKLECTFWFSVPSFLIYLTNMRLLNKDTFKSIRAFSFGGEGYPKDLLIKLYSLYSEKADFFNVYGPTEGTCICSAYIISDSDFDDMHGLVTLGKIASIFDYLILDDNNQESKKGELCLIGEQLALGYYNDKERTEISFVDTPINSITPQKMYKTGDLVEEIDGKLYFIGRIDNQIKHMGYRIELEEIEANLIKLDYIEQCAVVHGKTTQGFSRIIANIVCNKDLDQQELRKDLKSTLPDYMIPNTFEVVSELPKNSNGKIDRKTIKRNAILK